MESSYKKEENNSSQETSLPQNAPLVPGGLQNYELEELGNNYRLFLTWRYGIFGGLLAVLWVSIKGITALLTTSIDPLFKSLTILLITVVTLALWMADIRNRSLFRALLERAKEEAIYKPLADKSYPKHTAAFSHSRAIDLVSAVIIIFTLNLAVFTYQSFDIYNNNIKDIKGFGWLMCGNSVLFICMVFSDIFRYIRDHYKAKKNHKKASSPEKK